MKKLGCLYTGLLVLSFSARAMEPDVIELNTTSPVDYTLPVAQSLKGLCLRKCVDILLSDSEFSDKLLKSLENLGVEEDSSDSECSNELLESLEGQGVKNDHRGMVKAALINEYLVVLCKIFKDEFRVAELDYYKKREPREGLSELDCAYEGVIAGVLTSNEGIVFLSFRKEREGCVPSLDYWPFGYLENKEREPRYQCKIPIRYSGRTESFSRVIEMFSEPYTNRFFIYYDYGSSCKICQLWRLGEEGFEHELSFTFDPSYIKFSLDGKKLCMKGGRSSNYLLLFEDIDTLKSYAAENILQEDQLRSFGITGDFEDFYNSKNPLLKLCSSSSDWSSAGIIAMLSDRSIMIELRDIDDISLIKSCFTLNNKEEQLASPRTIWEKMNPQLAQLTSFSVLRILASGRYLLAETKEKVWLIDTVSGRAELLASSGVGKHTVLNSVKTGNGLRTSNDERFAILTWQNRNPILCDLKRKMNVEIKVGSKEEVSMPFWVLRNYPGSYLLDRANIRSTFLTSGNDILLFLLDRRIRFVCLKLALEAKSLRELVEQIKKRDAITTENTHHHIDGE